MRRLSPSIIYHLGQIAHSPVSACASLRVLRTLSALLVRYCDVVLRLPERCTCTLQSAKRKAQSGKRQDQENIRASTLDASGTSAAIGALSRLT